jgi:hypothetical protein
MKQRKIRIEIPREKAAKVLFLSDRTCCVCRVPKKPVQIHHIDEDPRNNELENLAVLCLDCHRETMLRGGFDRKLDGEQVTLYRDDWFHTVARNRVFQNAERAKSMKDEESQIKWATSLADIYRENGDNEALAVHYDVVGNEELRDKYIELALQNAPTDQTVVFLRDLQGRPELIPEDVVTRQMEWTTKNEDWSRRARLHSTLGHYVDATADYVRQVTNALENGNVFCAAYYLKELVDKGLIQELFTEALKNAQENDDLWWQIRALQELGWHTELNDLVLSRSDEIAKTDDPMLLGLLAAARGDTWESLDAAKKFAQESLFSELAFDPERDAADYPR